MSSMRDCCLESLGGGILKLEGCGSIRAMIDINWTLIPLRCRGGG